MTDGENLIGGNNVNGPVMSHYSAYGYMRWGRFPSENFQVAQNHLDERMRLVCANAKAKGVTIISILFRVNTQRSRDLLRNCASSGNLFYLASNNNELQRAFAEVASYIGRIRLTRERHKAAGEMKKPRFQPGLSSWRRERDLDAEPR